MRNIGSLLLVGAAVLAPLAATAVTTVDYVGYAWDTGGFPSQAGDSLRIPIVITGLSPELQFDPANEEVTGFIHGLISNGPQDAGDGITRYTFGTGRMEIWRDPARDHGYGEFPPNASAPSTFTNGTLCLAGEVRDFVLYFDAETGSGAYEGNVFFGEGSCLGQLSAASAEGFTFGGVLSREVALVPQGYDLSIDGFLEAQEKPMGCPFDCLQLTSARLDFERRPPRHLGPRDGKFKIEGAFDPCDSFGDLDPSQHEVRVRIGEYQQVLPAGTLRREPGSSHEDIEWEFQNHAGTATITELEIVLDEDGAWEFQIEGRGIPRSQLLGDGLQLQVELHIDDMSGTAVAMLVQKKHRLRFHGGDEPCGAPEPDDDTSKTLAAGWGLQPATPNPFNATTSIQLRTAADGPAQLRVYDVRGRLVSTLHSGSLAAGEHRFVWNGMDEGGHAVASGIYIYRVETLGFTENHKMVLAK